jgi:predicted N-acetyltransferase YhbS
MSQEFLLPLSTDFAPEAGRRRVRLPVLGARGGDHATIYYFLQSIFQGPPRTEFNASLQDPSYEPSDRLLLWQKRRIAAHVRLTHRTMQLGSTTIPIARLTALGVAPEHRNQGFGTHLLRAAENRMTAGGALVGVLRTSLPHFFRRTGWALCGQPSYRRADARALLSSPPPPPAHSPLAAMGAGGIGADL